MVNADEERKRKNAQSRLYTNSEGSAGTAGATRETGREQALAARSTSGTRAQQKAQFDARQARPVQKPQVSLMMPTNKTNAAIAAYNNAQVNLAGQRNDLTETKLRGATTIKSGQALAESNIERDRLRAEQGLTSQREAGTIASESANLLNDRRIAAAALTNDRARSNQARTQALSAWAGGANPDDVAAVQNAGTGNVPFGELSRNVPLSRSTVSKEKAVVGMQDISDQYNTWKQGPGKIGTATFQDYLVEMGLSEVYDTYSNALGTSAGDKAVEELLK